MSFSGACATEPDKSHASKAVLNFREQYALLDGQYVKRIGKPFPASRAAYREAFGLSSSKQDHLPSYLLLAWEGGDDASALSGGAYRKLQSGSHVKGASLLDLVESVVGLPSYQVRTDRFLLARRFEGDWYIGRNA